MVNEIMLDVENVFRWDRGRDHDLLRGRIDWIRGQLEALLWWNDQHFPAEQALPTTTSGILGYGKLDPSGLSFNYCILDWSVAGGVRTNRLNEFSRRGENEELIGNVVVLTELTPGPTASFSLVGLEEHAGETLLLEEAERHVLVDGQASRLVLVSRDRLVTGFYSAHADADLLLAYGEPKASVHQGYARVVSLPTLVEVHRNLNRLPVPLLPGAEITPAVLAEISLPNASTRPVRAEKSLAHQRVFEGLRTGDLLSTGTQSEVLDLIRALAGDVQERPMRNNPLEALKRVDWRTLSESAPPAQAWISAWGSRYLHEAVAETMRSELRAIAATNDELSQCILGLWDGAKDDALTAYRAFALMALHRSDASANDSLGAAIRSDPELHEQFWRPYVLIQPYLSVLDVADPSEVAEKPPVDHRGKRTRNPRLHQVAAALGIDLTTAIQYLREAGLGHSNPADPMGRRAVRLLEAAVQAHGAGETVMDQHSEPDIA